MRFVTRQSVVCERGREWISLRLDGELSELAQKMLDSHLARCAECRAFAAEAAATTQLLRSTPLEQLERPLTLPHTRRFALSMRRVSAMAASAAAIALGVAAFLNLPSSGTLAATPPVHVSPSRNTDITQFRLFRAAMLRPVVLPPRPTHGPQKN
jgi:predicted anti-sigma-YlaC factor YlaD